MVKIDQEKPLLDCHSLLIRRSTLKFLLKIHSMQKAFQIIPKILPVMLEQCLMLSSLYYAKNYAGMCNRHKLTVCIIGGLLYRYKLCMVNPHFGLCIKFDFSRFLGVCIWTHIYPVGMVVTGNYVHYILLCSYVVFLDFILHKSVHTPSLNFQFLCVFCKHMLPTVCMYVCTCN